MSYDAAGNLTTDSYSGYGAMTYNADNKMVAAQDSLAGWSYYTYNADGQRVRRKINNVETWAIYGMDGEMVAEYAASGATANPQKEYGYRNGQLLISADTGASQVRTNVAATANGGVATASSTLGSGWAASGANNGDRKGTNWGSGGGWADASSGSFPDWIEIAFSASKTIDEIDVFTLQDNPASPIEPTLTTTFSTYGLSGYDVQYWDGTTWVTVSGGSITGNNNVWKKITFTAVATTKIRVLANAAIDNGYTRITEVEAWGNTAPAASTNVAASVNGGVATASSTLGSGWPASGANNGDRKGTNWGSGGGWADASSGSFPDWIEIAFSGSQSINEIDVFTLQDNYGSPIEPTLTTTFSTYGLSAYDVQYWNGTSWVTVSGGSITGNNKVWKQLTFSAVTTTKIRVLANAAIDNGYTRITEVEAWSPLTVSAGVQWLVTDQLGTPRMVFDQTGSYSSVKRHDYLPFGEELVSGVGGRNTAQGYGGSDGVRQQFTQKERDTETGLDYSINRYYSPAQGRFSSVDPLLESGEAPQPQSWNRYSYSINNPLRFVDPDGLRYVQRTLADGTIQYGWCGTDECYNNAIDKKGKNYAGWTAVTFDESKPYDYTCECGGGGDRYGQYRLNPDGTHGYADVLDGNYHAMSTDWNAQLAIGGVFKGLMGALGGLMDALAEGTTESATQATTQGAAQVAGNTARSASSAFGRSIQSLRQSLSSGDGVWRRVAAHAEQAAGRAYRGATSMEEVFVNRQTGERIIKHTIVRGQQVLHETFRTFGKFGK